MHLADLGRRFLEVGIARSLVEIGVIVFGLYVATRIAGDLYILFTEPDAWKWPDDDDLGMH